MLKFIFAHGLHAIIVYRFGRWIDLRFQGKQWIPLKSVLNIVYDAANWLTKNAYGISLSRDADIGPGLLIGHFGGIEVGPCTIGANCSIQQQVRILPCKKKGRRAMIGNFVWVGGHSTVEGCTIGDRVTISAGSRVLNDVSPGNLIAGNPARVVQANYNNDEIIGITV